MTLLTCSCQIVLGSCIVLGFEMKSVLVSYGAMVHRSQIPLASEFFSFTGMNQSILLLDLRDLSLEKKDHLFKCPYFANEEQRPRRLSDLHNIT